MLYKFKDLESKVDATLHWVGADLTSITWNTPSGIEYDLTTDFLEVFVNRVIVLWVPAERRIVRVFTYDETDEVYSVIDKLYV